MTKNEKLKKLDVKETSTVSGGGKIYCLKGSEASRERYYFFSPTTWTVETANSLQEACRRTRMNADSVVECRNFDEVQQWLKREEEAYPFTF